MSDELELEPGVPVEAASEQAKQQFRWYHALMLIGSVTITVLIFLYHDQLEGSLRGLSYLGAFLAMLMGNATIILPVPGLIIVYLLGAQLNPLLLGLAAGPGAALGELTGYFAGYGGSALIGDRATYLRIRGWMRRYGLLVIAVLAAIPNPVFDMAGIVAGSMRLRWWKFLLAAAIGKIIQSILVAQAGALSIDWVRTLLD